MRFVSKVDKHQRNWYSQKQLVFFDISSNQLLLVLKKKNIFFCWCEFLELMTNMTSEKKQQHGEARNNEWFRFILFFIYLKLESMFQIWIKIAISFKVYQFYTDLKCFFNCFLFFQNKITLVFETRPFGLYLCGKVVFRVEQKYLQIDKNLKNHEIIKIFNDKENYDCIPEDDYYVLEHITNCELPVSVIFDSVTKLM
jgi:hypothetical protein